ncbi:WXG100 family type VII secretion target [Nocardia callitridis]|uniref:WXG100 family type VII secretion target n=1 Tax=Nocardia callitridis TaxID=648753 RepID=A0ABP9KRV9_9NOCA
MAVTYTGDSDQLFAASKRFFTHADTFKNNLAVLEGIKMEYATAIQGQTGNAVQTSMQQSLDKGNRLHRTFMEMVDALHTAGSTFDSEDQNNASMVNRNNLDF